MKLCQIFVINFSKLSSKLHWNFVKTSQSFKTSGNLCQNFMKLCQNFTKLCQYFTWLSQNFFMKLCQNFTWNFVKTVTRYLSHRFLSNHENLCLAFLAFVKLCQTLSNFVRLCQNLSNTSLKLLSRSLRSQIKVWSCCWDTSPIEIQLELRLAERLVRWTRTCWQVGQVNFDLSNLAMGFGVSSHLLFLFLLMFLSRSS